MNYRKDVQILRGIAVLLVVLFHLGLGGFASGFLGVDVFFVISGYLMAAMYDPANKASFYAKRAKRLLPAYFATVVATLVAAMAITTPNDFGQVAKQAWFASAFVSNVGFWLENSYFDKAAFKPLLHLWSLGVEIQFYLLVPAVYWFLRKTRLAGYAVLIGGSMALCFLVVGVSPKTSFFWLPTRLWEFLLGFGVANLVAQGKKLPQAVGVVGLGLILLIPLMPVNGEALGAARGHPGLAAAVITFATAAILAAGLPSALLATRMSGWLERLGDWSYSVYLAHFPLIVLALYEPFDGTVLKPSSPARLGLVLLLIVAVSAALYRLVERPLRHVPARPWWAMPAVGAVMGAAMAGPLVQAATVPAAERAIYAAWEDRAPYRCGQLARILHPTAKTCELTTVANPALRVLLVGNSHADSIKATFAQEAQARGVAVHFIVDNNPMLPGSSLGPMQLVQQARALGAQALAVHYSPGAVQAADIEALATEAAKAGIRTVFIMPVPTRQRSVPLELWESAKSGAALKLDTISDYRSRNKNLAAGLARISVPGFQVYDIAGAFCAPECQLTTPDGRPYYFDSGHLTLTGSARLAAIFDSVINDLTRKESTQMEANMKARSSS